MSHSTDSAEDAPAWRGEKRAERAEVADGRETDLVPVVVELEEFLLRGSRLGRGSQLVGLSGHPGEDEMNSGQRWRC